MRDLQQAIQSLQQGHHRSLDIPCPAHNDKDPSLSVSPADGGKVLLHCHAGCSPGAVLQAAGLSWSDLYSSGGPPSKADSRSRGNKRSSGCHGKSYDDRIEATYDYCDEGGNLLFQVMRLKDPKDFRQRRPNRKGGWIWSIKGVRRVLYRLPELQNARRVVIAEGEKDVDFLQHAKICATTNPMGTGGGWSEDYAQQLQSAGTEEVVVIPDNDTAGMKHAEAAALFCHTAGMRVKLLQLPALEEKEDVTDWLEKGNTADDLLKLINAAPEWKPRGSDDEPEPSSQGHYESSSDRDEIELERLSALTPMEYDRCRKDMAVALGVSVTTLDKQVAQYRRMAVEPASGEPAIIEDIEPWPDPVDGAELLDEMTESARRHLVLPPGGAEAMALWALHSHVHDRADVSPLLAFTSPTPECGKTTCLTWMGAHVARPLPASNITAAALFRSVEKWRPCLLVDEADTFLRNSDDLRGILNSGHHRANAFVLRTAGEDHEPRRFTTWAPKAVALIGKLPATLASRSVHIELRRKKPHEQVVPLRLDRLDDFEPLRRKAARWAADTDLADPDMPSALQGRAADNWRILLAIADAAGGDWPRRAREAAQALSGGHGEETTGILLLQDMRALFDDHGDRITSGEVVEALTAMEDRPWMEWKQGRPLTVRQLARLLEPFGLKPKQLWIDGNKERGYAREAFEDAFARYLSDRTGRTVEASADAGFGDFGNGRAENHLPGEKSLKRSTDAGSTALPDQNGRTPVEVGII